MAHVGKIERDAEGFLLVFSNEIVREFSIEEGDEITHATGENGKLELIHEKR